MVSCGNYPPGGVKSEGVELVVRLVSDKDGEKKWHPLELRWDIGDTPIIKKEGNIYL